MEALLLIFESLWVFVSIRMNLFSNTFVGMLQVKIQINFLTLVDSQLPLSLSNNSWLIRDRRRE